jgi:hypothetical protein
VFPSDPLGEPRVITPWTASKAARCRRTPYPHSERFPHECDLPRRDRVLALRAHFLSALSFDADVFETSFERESCFTPTLSENLSVAAPRTA